MQEKPTVGSPLARLYHSINKTAQAHFRTEWIKHNDKHRVSFYNRLEVPFIEDLALFRHIFNVLTVSDQVMKSYDFSKVEKYEELETLEMIAAR